MTKRITEPNNQVLRIMIAFGVLGVGFYGLTQVDFYYIQFSFLVISGLVSYLLVFGFVGVRQLFSTPKRLIKTFLLIFSWFTNLWYVGFDDHGNTGTVVRYSDESK